MKDKLLNILANPANKLIAVDLDNTLSEGEYWGEGPEPRPIQSRIDYIRDIYRKGAHIIIYTARPPLWFNETNAWLIKHNVPHHGLSMQRKPGADLYIDDKALNIDDVFVGL